MDRARAPLLTEAELFRHRAADSALLEAARPALTQARTLLSQEELDAILMGRLGSDS